MKCPVCSYQIQMTYDYMDYTLMEEYGTCQCGYGYSYLTGAYQETFGAFEFYEYYTGDKAKNTILPYVLVLWLYRIAWLIRSM